MPASRVLLCLPNIPVTFPSTGLYEAVVNVDGVIEARTPFHVTLMMEAPSPE
jgi:hypothetical protein